MVSDPQRPHGLHAAFHAPPSMGFSRQEYWSGVPLPSLENEHKPYLIATSVALAVGWEAQVLALDERFSPGVGIRITWKVSERSVLGSIQAMSELVRLGGIRACVFLTNPR